MPLVYAEIHMQSPQHRVRPSLSKGQDSQANIPLFLFSFFSQPGSQLRPPNLHPPRHTERHHRCQHTTPTKQLQAQVAPSLRLNDRARDRAARQRAKRHDRHRRAGADPDLADVANLRNQRRHETDEAAAREAEDGGEDHDGSGGVGGRDPHGERDNGRQASDGDHGVEAADAVGGDAGEDTPEDAVCEGWRQSARTFLIWDMDGKKNGAVAVTYLTAFRMGIRYCSNSLPIPAAFACNKI